MLLRRDHVGPYCLAWARFAGKQGGCSKLKALKIAALRAHAKTSNQRSFRFTTLYVTQRPAPAPVLFGLYMKLDLVLLGVFIPAQALKSTRQKGTVFRSSCGAWPGRCHSKDCESPTAARESQAYLSSVHHRIGFKFSGFKFGV